MPSARSDDQRRGTRIRQVGESAIPRGRFHLGLVELATQGCAHRWGRRGADLVRERLEDESRDCTQMVV